jgi:hypothetical protein
MGIRDLWNENRLAASGEVSSVLGAKTSEATRKTFLDLEERKGKGRGGPPVVLSCPSSSPAHDETLSDPLAPVLVVGRVTRL